MCIFTIHARRTHTPLSYIHNLPTKKKANEFPSPEEASSLRPRSLERERQRRASSNASTSSSTSGGGGSLHSSSGGSGYYYSSSRRASASASSVRGGSSYGSSSSIGDGQEDEEGTEGRPRPVSLPHTAVANAAPVVSRRRHGHSNTWSTPLDEVDIYSRVVWAAVVLYVYVYGHMIHD